MDATYLSLNLLLLYFWSYCCNDYEIRPQETINIVLSYSAKCVLIS